MACTKNHRESSIVRESLGCQEGVLRDEEVRWVGAGPEGFMLRHLDFPLKHGGDTERVFEASGKMSELCFRDGSREAVRKLCQ